MWAIESNPITTNLAIQGIENLYESLPFLTKNPKEKDARSKALYGAYACGTVLGQVGMSLHHKLVKKKTLSLSLSYIFFLLLLISIYN